MYTNHRAVSAQPVIIFYVFIPALLVSVDAPNLVPTVYMPPWSGMHYVENSLLIRYSITPLGFLHSFVYDITVKNCALVAQGSLGAPGLWAR